MEILHTKKLLTAKDSPTQLDFERILAARQSSHNDYFLKNLEAGLAGEETLLKFLELYGRQDWQGMRNIWLNRSGKFECDFILLAKAGLHLFEIKNYTGHFIYENGDCVLNNRVLPDNPIMQTQRSFRKLKSIIHRLDPTISVTGTLVFIGEHNFINIHSAVSDITILTRDQLRDFILKLAAADQYDSQNINVERIIRQLEYYEDENYFVPKPLSDFEMQKLRKGIYCANCQSFEIAISKLYIHCSCGYKESRKKGILRTICEYSVLTMKSEITHSEALSILDGQVSDKYLYTIMKKFFIQCEKNRYTYYEIDPVPFSRNKSFLNKFETDG